MISLRIPLLCLFLNLLAQSGYAQGVISPQEENDLELSSGIFDALDRTQTTRGKKALRAIVGSPLVNIAQLLKRQQAIREMVANPQLLQAIDSQLAIYREHEQILESFTQERDPISKDLIDNFYFTHDRLKQHNHKPTALNILQTINLGTMISPVIIHALEHWGLTEYLFAHKGCAHSPAPQQTTLQKTGMYLFHTIEIVAHIHGLKMLYDHAKQKSKATKELQSNVIQAGKCFKSLKEIALLIQATPDFAHNLAQFPHLDVFFEHPSDQTVALEALLDKKTFKDVPSLMSNLGNTLAAHKMISEIKDLDNILDALGEIDAYVSIAKLYNEHVDQTHRYSFASYRTHAQPQIVAQEYWNPSIGSKNCCANSLELGVNNPNTAVITGPNMAGKSTNLKSLSLVILLGQTLTIVPAEFAQFTPFTKITTFMRHTDDIQAGTSLFTAELIKANIFVDMLQNMKDDQFSLVIFDELFKSTSFEKGQSTAYNLIKYIGNIKNNLCMVSTHYPQLANLEQDDNKLFKNYTASTEKNKLGHTVFILKNGSSTAQQSFDVLKEQGIRGIWENRA